MKNATGYFAIEIWDAPRGWTRIYNGAVGINKATAWANRAARRFNADSRVVTEQTGEIVDENGWTAPTSNLRAINRLFAQSSTTPSGEV